MPDTTTTRPVQTLAPFAPASTAIAKRRSAMASLAARLDVEPNALMRTLQNTVFKGATNEEFASLCIVSNVYGLNPLTKEIYAFPAKGGIVPMVSVDGWSRIANQQPAYDGCDFEDGRHPDFGPWIRCIVYRKDRSHPTVATEYLAECQTYYFGKDNQRHLNPGWEKTPMRMLRHRAFIQAVRLAFGLGGIYAPEDGDPADSLPPADPAPQNRREIAPENAQEARDIAEGEIVQPTPAPAPSGAESAENEPF